MSEANVTVQIKDHSQELTARLGIFADTLMGLLAATIEAQMKTGGSVPLLPKSTKWATRGALRASIRHQKVSLGKYKVTMGTGTVADKYAAAQEAGQTRGHPIRHYSTPGTHSHFFIEAVLAVEGNKEEYVMRAKDAAGLGRGF